MCKGKFNNYDKLKPERFAGRNAIEARKHNRIWRSLRVLDSGASMKIVAWLNQ
jgi:hypothetical protein